MNVLEEAVVNISPAADGLHTTSSQTFLCVCVRLVLEPAVVSLCSTWKHLEWTVVLQAEDQSLGCDAEDLPGGEVHAVIGLEVEASRHGTC